MRKILLTNKYLILISLAYLIFRLNNLTVLPIFNDEAIYLDWGWRATHIPGNLFYSLYDAKQPLLMWVFGITQILVEDPLIAGRLVSVVTGLLTLLGIYKIANRFFNKKAAFIALVLYIFIPIFSFYDRQALMESAIASGGIWSLYLFLRWSETKKMLYSGLLGLVLGIGFLIKSSAAVFILTSLMLYLITYLFYKTSKTDFAKAVIITLSGFITVTFILFLQPAYWQTLPSNQRYARSISELPQLPIREVMNDMIGNIDILFFYITPVIFLLAIVGGYKLYKTKKTSHIVILFWFVLSIVIQILFVKHTSQRYLVSFLPIMTVFVGYFLSEFQQTRQKMINLFLSCIVFVVPFLLTVFQLYQPAEYIRTLSRISAYAESSYISSYTSGYGVTEVIAFLQNESKKQPIFVGFALNTGNPESALMTYLHADDNIRVNYFDSQMFENELNSVDCLASLTPLYFVSRDEQQANLNKYFMKIKTFYNPYGPNTIGIYTLKSNCTGKTLNLQL